MLSMRRSRLTAGLAVVALLAAACSSGDSESGGSSESSGEGSGSSEASGGSFSAQSGEPSSLVPTSQCYETECSRVLTNVFAPLVLVDPETSEPAYIAAESIDSKDGTTWTVKLREGWKFHNGEPMNAESYIRAWNYSAYGPNATQTGFFFSPVEGYDDLQGKKPKAKEMSGLKAVDDTTIEIKLSEPFSQWPLTMGYTPAFAPIAEECMKDLKACNESPIGTGPYMMDGQWQHNDKIMLKKYADYQGENAGNADQIEVKIYGNLVTAFKDFQAGNLDITTPDPTQLTQARALVGDRIVEVDNGSFAYLGFPFYEDAFQDPKLREALSMAIDRETIIEKVYSGTFTPAQDVLPPFVPGSRTDACPKCVYDPDEAKKLYDESGGLPDDKVTIWFNNDGGHEQFIQAVANGWRNDLGIDFELESQPFAAYLATLGKGSVDGPYRLGWAPDYPSPENYLDPIYGEGSSNYGEWAGPEHEKFLDLVAEGDAASSVEEGIPSYQAAADVVLEDLPVIPLWFGQSSTVYSENVDNVTYDPLQQEVLTEVTVTQ